MVDPTNMCPLLQDNTLEQIDDIGGYQGQQVQQRQKHVFFLNIYNPRWRDHHNISYLGSQQRGGPNGKFNNPLGFTQPRPQHPYQSRP